MNNIKAYSLPAELLRGLVFDESTHKYSIDGVSSDIVSVTTFIAKFFAPFDAESIAVNLCESHPSYIGTPPEALMAQWAAETQAGTDAHKELEDYIMSGTKPTKPKAIAGVNWLNNQNWDDKELYTEVRIFSEELGIAGTVDLLVKDLKSESYSIYDWKTNKKIDFSGYNGKRGILPPTARLDDCKYIVYGLQMSLYRLILESEYGLKVTGQTLLHLGNICNPIKTSYLKDELLGMIEYYKEKKV